jgi:two-component system cell cycle sensor histidine kinase/response regulator CckA
LGRRSARKTIEKQANDNHGDKQQARSNPVLRELQLAALEAAANAILISDKSGTILWTNSAFERITGYTRQEITGQNSRILRSGQHPENFYQELWSTILAGKVWRGEIINRRKDGTLYTEQMTITPIRVSWEISHFIAVKEDVSESKRVDAALAESDQRFRLAFEKGPLGIVFVDPQYRVITANPAFCSMLGYSEPELRGRQLTEVTHPEDAARDKETSARIMRGGIPAKTWEKRYLSKNGQPVFVEVTATTVRDLSGNPLYGMGIVQNISRRKASESAIRQAEERYRSIFKEAIVGVFQTTPEGQFLVANPELLRIFGYQSMQDLADNVKDIGRDLHVDVRRRREFKDLMDSRGFVRGFECELYRKDRKRIWVSISARAVRHENALICYEGMLEDISERKLLKEQFREAQKLEAIGQLAGGVAHDFNNALGVITGYSELLQERLAAGDPLHRYLAGINKEVQRAASLTQQLLAFSRKQVIQPVPLDLNSTVANAEKILGRIIGEDIVLTTALESPLGLIHADPGQIEQVIMNLAVNARDAMPEGGDLIIKTGNRIVSQVNPERSGEKPGSYVNLSVTDTGCGITTDVMPHIFEPFFTTKPPGKGTGLGLATVYGIVQQNGGYLWVDTGPGKGTTFNLCFPQISPSDAPRFVASSLPAQRTSGTETILLVEDEGGLRQVFVEALSAKGYRVLDAENGLRALELARAHPGDIHLLVTDVVIPGLSGPKLAEQLSASRPGIKVLYISGYTRDLIAQHGLSQEPAALLRKPFTPQSLLTQIRAILDGVPANFDESRIRS